MRAIATGGCLSVVSPAIVQKRLNRTRCCLGRRLRTSWPAVASDLRLPEEFWKKISTELKNSHAYPKVTFSKQTWNELRHRSVNFVTAVPSIHRQCCCFGHAVEGNSLWSFIILDWGFWCTIFGADRRYCRKEVDHLSKSSNMPIQYLRVASKPTWMSFAY